MMTGHPVYKGRPVPEPEDIAAVFFYLGVALGAGVMGLAWLLVAWL